MVYDLIMDSMPQTVPKPTDLSFDYNTFQFDLSLLSDEHSTINSTAMVLSHLQVGCGNLKSLQIKQEACLSRPISPTSTFTNSLNQPESTVIIPNDDISPITHYYLSQGPQNMQIHPKSPINIVTKQQVKRENSFDLLAILHESRLLAESLGYKEDSTDCTVPCTPPRTEEDIYSSLDADFFPKKEESNPLLKEILFREDNRFSLFSTSSISSSASTCSSSSIASSPIPPPLDYEKSSLRDLIFLNSISTTSSVDTEKENMVVVKGDKISDNDSFKDLVEEESKFKGDHQLLREVLRDTSFQRKYNLKPVDLDTVGTSFIENMTESSECVGDLAREQIEPVLNLAIQQLQKDFDNTCVALGIHPEPRHWSTADVAAWVQWARRQLQLPSVSLDNFNVDGMTLTTFTEEEFCQRAPTCGSMLYAQLEIWKTAVEESPRNSLSVSWTPTSIVNCSENGSSSSSITTCSDNHKGSCNMDNSDDEDEMNPAEISTGNSTNSKIRSNSSHIHLWQFLRELLQSPNIYSSCIRWLDRSKGVFKIEDSVRVARLWGKRKNRPAMNYDKLSRSIRQYYKKGIMKKTERSQRLVYQFCHPYCL